MPTETETEIEMLIFKPIDREPTTEERQVFLEAANALATLRKSGLHLYLVDGILHLMSGPPHDVNGWREARKDRIRESVKIPNLGNSANKW